MRMFLAGMPMHGDRRPATITCLHGSSAQDTHGGRKSTMSISSCDYRLCCILAHAPCSCTPFQLETITLLVSQLPCQAAVF